MKTVLTKLPAHLLILVNDRLGKMRYTPREIDLKGWLNPEPADACLYELRALLSYEAKAGGEYGACGHWVLAIKVKNNWFKLDD